MKIFSKVLAMVLALFTVLALVPISAIAAPWADVDAETNGSESKVTLTLDAAAFAEILKSEGISPALLSSLMANVSVDVDALMEAFSLEELFQIVPQEVLLNALGFEEFVQSMEIEELTGYINDFPAFIKSVMAQDGAAEKLAAILGNLTDYANAGAVLENGYLVPLGSVALETLILNNISTDKREALINAVVADDVKVATLKSLLESKTATMTQTELENLFDVEKLFNDGKITVDALLDLSVAKTQIMAIPAATLLSATNGYVDILGVFTLIGLDNAIDLIGGYAAAVAGNYVNTAAVMAQINVQATLENIFDDVAAENVALEDVIYVNAIIADLDADDLFTLVDFNTIMANLKEGALVEILKSLDLKAKALELLTLVYNYVMKNVDKLSLNDVIVAAEANDGTGLLQIYADKLMAAIWAAVPTLDDLCDIKDNVLLSFHIDMEYTVDGTDLTPTPVKNNKCITFELALAGDLSVLENAAASLKALVDRYINQLKITPNEIIIDLQVPGKFTALYAKVLDTDALSDELKVKIMNITNLTGDDLIAFVEENLTFDDILSILASVDVDALFERLKANAMVETVLTQAGVNVDALTLDKVIDRVVNSGISVENVCDALSSMIGKDVMAIIDSLSIKADQLIDRAEKISAVERVFAAVESKLGVDLSEISIETLVDTYADVPVMDVVANAIEAKLGVDIRAVAENYSAQELWDAAVAKAEGLRDEYNKVRNYLLAAMNMMPDALLDACVADAYKGDGRFSLSTSITTNPGAFIEKALNKIAGMVDNSKVDAIVSFIMARVDLGDEITTDITAALNFANLYRINYYARDLETLLFTAFVPAGADLSIYKNNSDLTGYEFTGWFDIDGNPVEVMPAADTDVYADVNAIELTFVDGNNNVLGTILLPENGSLDIDEKYLDALAAINGLVNLPEIPEELKLLIDYYRVFWTFEDADGVVTIDLDKNLGLDYIFTEDTTLVCDWAPAYFLNFGDADIDYSVEINGSEVVLVIHGDKPDSFVLNLDRANLLAAAAANADMTLTITVDTEAYDFLFFENATLAKAYADSTEKVTFSYAKTAQAPIDFATSVYANPDLAGVDFYSFEILADDTTPITTFGPDGENVAIDIYVPFAGAAFDKNLRVYTMVDGKRELVAAEVVEAGIVRFQPTHFSSFVLANENALNLTFRDEDGKAVNGWLNGYAQDDIFFPEGAIIKLEFANIDAYDVESITSSYNFGAVLSAGDEIVMPDESVSLTIRLTGATYYIYYYYYANGTLKQVTDGSGNPIVTEYRTSDPGFDANTFAEDHLIDFPQAVIDATPVGYDADTLTWGGYDADLLGYYDMHLIATYEEGPITIIYKDEQNNELLRLVVAGYEEIYKIAQSPAVPEGMVGDWEIKTTDINEATRTITVTLKALYTAVTAPIVIDGNVAKINGTDVETFVNGISAVAGTTVTVGAIARDGYTAVIYVNGTVAANGSFTMPAGTASITVEYVKNSYSYTVNGSAADSAEYGSVVEFSVTVPNGKILVNVSDICELVSIVRGEGGNKIYTYAFDLLGDTAISYELLDTPFSILKIFNGKLFEGTGEPTTDVKNVSGTWSEPAFGLVSFAVFTLNRQPASLLWLWILLAVLVFIGLVALLYVLHIKGKFKKPVFLARFVVWVVNLFFGLCLAVSALGLKIGKLFGKSDKAEDYGFTEVEDPYTEETAEEAVAEEAVEETAEEAVAEEAVEETAEEAVAEEAVEETAEEAVAEEAVEETAEEAVVEEAVEETAEEAVAEEAVEETAEEAVAEEAVEETAEEAVAEEAVEETAEEAATEEKKD